LSAEAGEVLITAEQIAARVRDLGADLAGAYAGREPILVAIMKGCILFLADLVRAWPGPMDLEFVSAESYVGTQPATLRVTLPANLAARVAGRPVLVIDDIYDTGRTLDAVARAVEALSPTEVRTLVLLHKRRAAAPHARLPSPGEHWETGVLQPAGPAVIPPATEAFSPCEPPPRPPHWVGFEIPDCFVVGYGLDYHGRYRNLPHVAALREAV
jgi:hypoxanthine phosphoribosyltransferase